MHYRILAALLAVVFICGCGKLSSMLPDNSYRALVYESKDIYRDTRESTAVTSHLMQADSEELIAWGGEDGKDRQMSVNPSQCECGRYWDLNIDERFFDTRPTQQQIDKCLQDLPWPTETQRCEKPCLAADEFGTELQYWHLWRKIETGKYRLFCVKRKQWHCLKVEP